VRGTTIGPLDRSGGFLFGLVRGLLVTVIPYIFLVWALNGPENLVANVRNAYNLPEDVRDARSRPFLAKSSEILLALIPVTDWASESPPQSSGRTKTAPKAAKKAEEPDADRERGKGYKPSERQGLDQLFESTVEN
jgi:membrane protein required for colicin V production